MNKQKSKASTAFSLIELSIVILIVGIIIAGVTQSSRLVRQSKLKSAQNLTQSSPVNSMSSIALWLETSQDASFPTQLDDGGFITQWNDTNPQTQTRFFAVPAAGIATSSSNISYDLEGINGLPSVSFNGTAANTGILTLSTSATTLTQAPVLTVADPNAANAFTAFMVYRLADTASGADFTVLYNGVSGTDGWGYFRDNTATNFRTVAIGPSATVRSGGALPTTQEIATITYSGYNAASATPGTRTTNLYINGGTNFTSTSGINATASTTGVTRPTTRAFIGGTTATTKPWNGLISEIIIFDTVLRNEDLRSVAQYLSKKYNIPLS
ncbi:MAG: prepilin-type N-terminal cleavage/methylation domain-containing protein [Proteobacteria bacterium]|nr:prepilin-type N-terminal cleavage/methylation domain-containing protein [Pseudomonadota bacterium]